MANQELASGLRRLKEKDIIEINGERYEVVSTEELLETGEPRRELEIKEEGMIIELKKEETDAFAPRYTLSFMDVESEYRRTAAFDGPPPLNPNPDIVFVQDIDANKTYKYSRTRGQKEKVELRFFKGEEEIRAESVILH